MQRQYRRRCSPPPELRGPQPGGDYAARPSVAEDRIQTGRDFTGFSFEILVHMKACDIRNAAGLPLKYMRQFMQQNRASTGSLRIAELRREIDSVSHRGSREALSGKRVHFTHLHAPQVDIQEFPEVFPNLSG